MKIARLLIEDDEHSAPLSLSLGSDVAQLDDHDEHKLDQARQALASFLAGSTAFGQAFIELNGIEIEASAEMASFFEQRFAGRNQIVDRTSIPPNSNTSEVAGAVALRAALELRNAIPRRLDTATAESALHTVQTEQHSIEEDAQQALAESTRVRDEAIEAISKIDHWSTAIQNANARAEAARAASRGLINRVVSYRRNAAFRSELTELLEDGNFASYDDYRSYAASSREHYETALRQAESDLAAATNDLESLTNGTSSWAHAQVLTIREYLLRLVADTLQSDREVSPEDLASIDNSIEMLTDLRDNPTNLAGDDALERAATWLGQIEGEPTREELERRMLLHAEQLPTLGTVPLVLDQLFDDMTPSAIRYALSALSPYVGRVQVITLGANEAVSRWATSTGRSQTN